MPAPATIRELLALHSKVKEHYPRRQETKGIGVRVDIGEQTNAVTELGVVDDAMRGLAFDSLKPDGQLLRAIRLDPLPPSGAVLSVLRADYQGWEQTWNEVWNIFHLMLPILLVRTRVVGLQLQFHDRFLWNGDAHDFSPGTLLRAGSGFLVPNVFRVQGPWHSHHGFFEQHDGPVPHHLLNVAEVQMTTRDPSNTEQHFDLMFDVIMTHRILGTNAHEEFNDLDCIDACMRQMHDRDKWLLAHIISDDMCDQIGLPRQGLDV